ncbi:hypothetical protein PY650_26805 [Rhizobium calliandrae]|uniref:Uncharacterized protein n=1 Tax=Rhizobium calliandrae TaxID=1312182 RepID=A0ABT7KKL3_9HYPH|nr:hypothetical protein [Rhizobium calliandrae]MDL2409179.1 hypothetical protein [Rhizobium calliandrae]
MKRKIVHCIAASLISFAGIAAAAENEIQLGDAQRITDLYSFPNNCSNVCYRSWSLEHTVEHYLNDSLRRDGFSSTTATVSMENGSYIAKLTGPEPIGFVDRYEAFLGLGDVALALARGFNSAGKWRYDWRFLLPLGLPMLNNRSLEVMDFPPLTLVLEKQDYLNSNTTNRWTSLLGENGIPKSDYELYGAILDVVPVAAPAGDGQRLDESGIYNGTFDTYGVPLLNLWTKTANAPEAKPIMALGSPMRSWFKRLFNVNLGILDVKQIKLPDGRTANIMGTNHPSYFFYAANKFTDGPDKDEKNFALGLEVMKQDIVAACWQAEMGKAPASDPMAMKATCTARWAGADKRLCVLVEMQAYRKTEDEATQFCEQRTFPSPFTPSRAELNNVEAEFNALQ